MFLADKGHQRLRAAALCKWSDVALCFHLLLIMM